jgi:predicted  nucleic acid-binding Zn-ribbon protein
MIKKLFNLKKSQTDQKLMYKAEIQNSISLFDEQINDLRVNINTSSVDRHGAISDFKVLEIHKETLRIEVRKLESQRNFLVTKINRLDLEIVQLQKEAEQYAYLLKEEKKELYKKLLLFEEEQASEFIQSKYITG